MEGSKVQFALMVSVVLNVVAMVLVLFIDVYVGAKIIIDFILAISTAILFILAWIVGSKRD